MCQFTCSQTHIHAYMQHSTARDNQLHCKLSNTFVQQIIVETNCFFRFFFGTNLNIGFGLIFLNSFFATFLSRFAHGMSGKRLMFNQNEKILKVVSFRMSHGQMETPRIFCHSYKFAVIGMVSVWMEKSRVS